MALFAYSAHNKREKIASSEEIDALLSVPLSRFKKTRGCTTGTTHRFTAEDIGKKFNVKILDPVEMRICIFKGFGFDAIPESKFKEEIAKSNRIVFSRALVFETTKERHLFLVLQTCCDATPKKEK